MVKEQIGTLNAGKDAEKGSLRHAGETVLLEN